MSTTAVGDLPDHLIESVIHEAFAPLMARQEEIENNTMARLETLHSTITLEDLPDDLIDNAVQGALAPLLERQEAMENNTMARLEALQALVSSLASVVKNMFQPNVNSEPPDHRARSPTNPSSPNASEYHPGSTLANNSSTESSDITGVSPSNRHTFVKSLYHGTNPPTRFPCNQ